MGMTERIRKGRRFKEGKGWIAIPRIVKGMVLLTLFLLFSNLLQLK
jgi:hypothetical protein